MKRKNFIILPALVLTALCILMIVQDGGIIGWLGAIFFGFGTVLFIYQAFNPKPEHKPDAQFYNDDTKEDRINTEGIFSYTNTGFTIELNGDKNQIEWHDIKTMFAYKRDLLTIDTIVLEVFCSNDYVFRIQEETRGWFQFTQRCKKALPSIDPSWDIDITVPAFATKFTLIYDRRNRTLEEASKQYYKS